MEKKMMNSVTMSLRIDAELKEKINRLAALAGVSPTEYIRDVLSEHTGFSNEQLNRLIKQRERNKKKAKELISKTKREMALFEQLSETLNELEELIEEKTKRKEQLELSLTK